MDNALYTYYAHQNELKKTARSARQKVTGRKPGKFMMPSDYLTAKERKDLSGTMTVYSMNKPHDYNELATWPKAYQKEYLENIISKYRPLSPQIMSDLLHKGPKTGYEYLAGLGIKLKKGQNRTQEQIEGWKRFLNCQEPEPEPEPEPEQEPPKLEQPQEKKLGLSYPEKVTIHTKGKPIQIFNTLAMFYCDPNCEYEIDVIAAKKIPNTLPDAEEADTDSIPEDEFC